MSGELGAAPAGGEFGAAGDEPPIDESLVCDDVQVRTIVLGEPPAELRAVIDRRRSLGQDTYDEVWSGDYHVAPAGSGRHGALQMAIGRALHPRVAAGGLQVTGPVNIGSPEDYRVPDAAVVRDVDQTWFPSAELVVEILSPDDETYAKLAFYARHGIPEVVVVDSDAKRVELYARSTRGDGYTADGTSRLLRCSAAELAGELDLR